MFGVFVAVVQFVEVKSEFCCNPKPPGGDGQERTRLVPERVMPIAAGGRETSNIGLTRLVTAKMFVPPWMVTMPKYWPGGVAGAMVIPNTTSL